MNKLLPLFVALIAFGCGWDSHSLLIAQTQSDANASPSATATASSAAEDENKPQLLNTSPSGTFRIVQTGEDFWIVAAADENQRTKMHSAEIVFPEEFRFSPDEKWLYAELHHGSCMSGADLYKRIDSKAGNNAAPFQLIEPPLEDGAWAEALKQRLFTRNFADEGVCAMVRFGGWSDDSSRLLLVIRGGEERGKTVGRYLYYNTRIGRFELTPYLRKVNSASAKSHEPNVLACAEPVDPLPDEATLKQQYAAVDKKLNENYQKRIADAGKEGKEMVAELRQSQRDWLKARDAGQQIYLAATSAAEKERRRLQFLIDVTRAEVEDEDASAASQ